MPRVFVQTSDDFSELREEPYDSEDVLQALVADHPGVLNPDQVGHEANRWLLVSRETGIPGEKEGGDRYALDLLLIGDNAVPTLVEVKRSDDTRIRREVVGQMLDYAANGVVYWPLDRLRAEFETRCASESKDPAVEFARTFGEDRDLEEFWNEVGQNLESGRIRLIFVADELPAELRRVIEFLNEQMSPAEVLGVEVRQYVGDGALRTLVPRVIGQTEQAQAKKRTHSSPVVDWQFYEDRLTEEQISIARQVFDQIESKVGEDGLPWTPVLRQSYFAFQRPGGYNVVGVALSTSEPVRFWIKLPANPGELQSRGFPINDPYPSLDSEYVSRSKQWHWSLPSSSGVPDLGPAVELSLKYQPESGPMLVPELRA